MRKTWPLVHAVFAIVAYGKDCRIGPQKIFGAMPGSIDKMTNRMVVSQTLDESRHGRIK
jgi:hypothetical protein